MRKGIIGFGIFALCLALTTGFDASAANWERFRGPNGTGIADDKNIPAEWTATKNIVWKVPVPGVGHSSPIIWGDKIFLETATPDFKERMLLCLSTKDGKAIWTKSITGEKTKIHAKSSPASGTPATDGERIYTPFWDGSKVYLHAYDFKGNKVWDRDLGSFSSQHGHGTSPAVFNGKVYYNHDQDGAAKILCFDAKTGKDVWSKERKAFRCSYSTPFVHETANGPEIIVGSTAGMTGYNPDTGAENWVWNWDFGGQAALRVVGSPIVSNGLALISSGDGSGARAMAAVPLGGKGNLSKNPIAWSNAKAFPYVPTMLTHGEHIYYVNDGGVAACHDVKTGKEIWKERLGGGVCSSPVLVDGKVYAPSEDGNVYVFAAAPTYKLLAKNPSGNVLRASPAVADGKLYVRTDTHLLCIGNK